MAQESVSFKGNILYQLALFIGIAIAVLALFFGVTIIVNFGTLLKIGFFVLGLFIANKLIFGGR